MEEAETYISCVDTAYVRENSTSQTNSLIRLSTYILAGTCNFWYIEGFLIPIPTKDLSLGSRYHSLNLHSFET